MAHPELATLKGMVDGPSPKPTAARFAIADNLRRLMSEYLKDDGREGLNPRELAALAQGVSYKTIQRMINPYYPGSPTLDSLDAVASFFRVDTFKLLVRRRALLEGSEPRRAEGRAMLSEMPARGKKLHVKKT